MKYKIGDQVVRPMAGCGLSVWQVVAIGGTWLNKKYILGDKKKDYYIQCSHKELFYCPDSMLLPSKDLLISTESL